MDWDGIIEDYRGALKRIVGDVAAMAGLEARVRPGRPLIRPNSVRPPSPTRGEGKAPHPRLGQAPASTICSRAAATPPSPLVGSEGRARRVARPGGSARSAETDEGCAASPATLPRYLHLMVMRLLRPAEAATRRLVVLVAAYLTPPQAPAPRREKPLRWRRMHEPLQPPQPDTTIRLPGFRLFDPKRRVPGPRRPRRNSIPRISVPGWMEPAPLPKPRSAFDELDATRLAARLSALAAALDDLPRHARRLARWRASLPRPGEAHPAPRPGRGARYPRFSPLRTGRPPGSRRRKRQEPHELLTDIHARAHYALNYADTS